MFLISHTFIPIYFSTVFNIHNTYNFVLFHRQPKPPHGLLNATRCGAATHDRTEHNSSDEWVRISTMHSLEPAYGRPQPWRKSTKTKTRVELRKARVLHMKHVACAFSGEFPLNNKGKLERPFSLWHKEKKTVFFKLIIEIDHRQWVWLKCLKKCEHRSPKFKKYIFYIMSVLLIHNYVIMY